MFLNNIIDVSYQALLTWHCFQCIVNFEIEIFGFITFDFMKGKTAQTNEKMSPGCGSLAGKNWLQQCIRTKDDSCKPMIFYLMPYKSIQATPYYHISAILVCR